MNNAVLQQATIVEFTIRNQQCVRCQANFAQGAWHAVVQVRQRASHKRTFFFLEQLLLKYNAHAEAVNIVVRNQYIYLIYILTKIFITAHRHSAMVWISTSQISSMV